MKDSIQERLSEEISSFKKVWEGGYFEGDVLDPVGYSTYAHFGYLSILHALYLFAIKPHVNSGSKVLEIGPGRGAFTKAILKHAPSEIWCLDALSAEYNKFWEYIGRRDEVNYIQVTDFSCSMLPEDHFNYFFSFGALCHVSFDGVTQYMANLFTKLSQGAECFIMVADYDKYNEALDNVAQLTVFNKLPFRKITSLNWLIYKLKFKNMLALRHKLPESLEPSPGRWYHSGIKRTCELLTSIGYHIVSEDIGILQRDPIIHFKKPFK